MPVAIIVSGAIYLMGNLRETLGPLAYSVADFLAGPVWAAGLMLMMLAVREQLGAHAPRRMALAWLAAGVAAAAFLAAACLRAANRHYHLLHPELHLENNSAVLVVWTTLVAGLLGTAWHGLGWMLALVGSAGWTSHRLPRLLSGLYLFGGAASLFVYLLPNLEGLAGTLLIVVSVWQGLWLWRAEPDKVTAYQPHF
jgi:hypothetical protein